MPPVCNLKLRLALIAQFPFSTGLIVSAAIGVSALPPSALAQNVTLDGTLGTPQVLTGPNYTIPQTAGQTVKQNLFQSFGRFNLNAGEKATFESAPEIRNIFSRVTGGEQSNINGTIATQGQNTNLFFINPNGILFGPSARLDVSGSFVASTANSINFADGTKFSANPAQSSPVLTVSVPLGLQFGSNPGPITVKGDGTGNGLEVKENHTLGLVGAGVTLQDGTVFAPNGNLEVGSVGDNSFVGISEISKGWRFDYAKATDFRDIQLSGRSFVSGNGANAGDVQVQGRKIGISEQSFILSIASGDSGQQSPGSIKVTGTESLQIDGDGTESGILSNVLINGKGDGANINIQTPSLVLQNKGAFIQSITNGQGKAGDITINARDKIVLNGQGNRGIFSNVSPSGKGDGANINIQTPSLVLQDEGAFIQSITSGQGKAGDITINARDKVVLNGQGGLRAKIFSFNNATSNGDGGGNIKIDTKILNIGNGLLATESSSQGKSGDISINAMDRVSVERGNGSVSGLFTASSNNESAGDIQIDTGTLEVKSGGQITSGTVGDRRGGAGNIRINARDMVQLDGVDPNNPLSSSTINILDGLNSPNSSTDKEIRITTGALSITNGAAIVTGGLEKTKAGNIFIQARDDVMVSGSFNVQRPDQLKSLGLISGPSSSRITSTAFGSDNPNNSGDVQINARSILVNEGGDISSDTGGRGKAGDIVLNARDSVVVDGESRQVFVPSGFTKNSEISSGALPGSSGQGGNIRVKTARFQASQGGIINSETFGQGNAGSISISASDRVVLTGTGQNFASQISSGTSSFTQATGNGGDITIDTGSLFIEKGAKLDASTVGNGSAGNITVNARDSISLEGKGEIKSLVGRAFTSQQRKSLESPGFQIVDEPTGNGGKIQLNAQSLSVANESVIATQSRGRGNAGDIRIQLKGRLSANNGFISNLSEKTSGGRISIQADSIRLSGDSDITSSVSKGNGNGGDISLSANSILALNDSDILAFAQDGKGGNINLNTRVFLGQNFRPAPSGTDPETLDFNNRADVNASGATSGIITLPDSDFIQNSFVTLSDNLINTETLLANSCIRREKKNGTFYITGSGNLPVAPGNPVPYTTYDTADVRPTKAAVKPTWKQGDAIVEPQGVFTLANGKRVMSRLCPGETAAAPASRTAQ